MESLFLWLYLLGVISSILLSVRKHVFIVQILIVTMSINLFLEKVSFLIDVWVCFVSAVLGLETRALHMISKHTTAELRAQPNFYSTAS
jgi:hypothetical protein